MESEQRTLFKSSKIRCHNCTKEFDQYELEIHSLNCLKEGIKNESLQSNQEIFTCEYCEKSYNNPVYYHKHLREDHKRLKDTIRCDICDKLFANRQSLNLHLDAQ